VNLQQFATFVSPGAPEIKLAAIPLQPKLVTVVASAVTLVPNDDPLAIPAFLARAV
jgi:hypothetical protein